MAVTEPRDMVFTGIENEHAPAFADGVEETLEQLGYRYDAVEHSPPDADGETTYKVLGLIGPHGTVVTVRTEADLDFMRRMEKTNPMEKVAILAVLDELRRSVKAKSDPPTAQDLLREKTLAEMAKWSPKYRDEFIRRLNDKDMVVMGEISDPPKEGGDGQAT